MSIRKGIPCDHPWLIALWRRAVEGTHLFLSAHDIQEIEQELQSVYLPAVDLWIAESVDDPMSGIDGFMGLDGSKVEMLFVEPARRGQGIGSRLLDHARSLHGTLTLDVNEQNTQAHGFYLHYGFIETGRSEADNAGRPFPLIHMHFAG
ncbi:MAG: acetyltransferase [Desulfovibrio sp.]|jgi:putative acetyltransferase|nr:acetyltransferase [Desulfovibrio sp.]